MDARIAIKNLTLGIHFISLSPQRYFAEITMSRKCFLSFHYKPDSWRVSKVKNMGKVEGQSILTANGWEEVKKKGDSAIKDWINEQLKGKSCQIVLIGAKTAERRWVKYEIEQAWNAGKGVFGVHIHNLSDHNHQKSEKGANPFSSFTVGGEKIPMTRYAKVYDPPYASSDNVYNYIRNNIEAWIEDAIKLRNSV